MYEDWAVGAQTAYRERFCKALISWATGRETLHDWESARGAAQRVVSMDPLREEAILVLMRVLARQGHVSGALDTFRQYEQRAREQLDAEPTPELRQLMTRLQREPEAFVTRVNSLMPLPAPQGKRVPLTSGTLTFLFTDIEGSTKLWEQHPHAMGVALARHDALLRETIQRTNGTVFKTIGDAFCAAFSTATDAVYAAIHAQLALASEPWHRETPLKVRMAVHTGAAESRDNDFFGAPLSRVSRMLGTAHGGQTVLSSTTQDLVRDVLPEGVVLAAKDRIHRFLGDIQNLVYQQSQAMFAVVENDHRQRVRFEVHVRPTRFQ